MLSRGGDNDIYREEGKCNSGVEREKQSWRERKRGRRTREGGSQKEKESWSNRMRVREDIRKKEIEDVKKENGERREKINNEEDREEWERSEDERDRQIRYGERLIF